MAGDAIGTPMFMSPEQVQAMADIDIRSDIYSLGATLFNLATGETPFEKIGVGGIFAQIISPNTPNPKKVTPRITSSLSNLIMKMMSKDREKRHQSPDELIEAMEGILQKRAKTPSSQLMRKYSPPSGGAPTQSSSSTSLIFGLLGLGVFLIFSVIFFGKNSTSPLNEKKSKLDKTLQKKKRLAKKKWDKKINKGNKKGDKTKKKVPPKKIIKIKKDPVKPDNTPKKDDSKKLINIFLQKFKKLLRAKNYKEALSLSRAFTGKHILKGWFNRVKGLIDTGEIKILTNLQKEDDLWFKKTFSSLKKLKERKKLYRDLSTLGNDKFQKELKTYLTKFKKLLTNLEKSFSLRHKLSQLEKEYFHQLRMWNFKKAKSLLKSIPEGTFTWPLEKRYLHLHFILKEVQKGYSFFTKTLSKLLRKRKRISYPFHKGEKCSAQWNSKYKTIVFKGVQTGRESYHTLIGDLGRIREFILKFYSVPLSQLRSYGLFYLYSGDLKGAEKFLPRAGKLIEREIKVSREYKVRRLHKLAMKGYRGRYFKFVIMTMYRLKNLGYRTRYYRKSKKKIEELFEKACIKYYRKYGLASLIQGKVKKLSMGKVKITYEFKNLRERKDWKGRRFFNLYFSGSFKAQGLKLSGRIQFQVPMKGDYQVTGLFYDKEVKNPTPQMGLLFDEKKIDRKFSKMYVIALGLNPKDLLLASMGNSKRPVPINLKKVKVTDATLNAVYYFPKVPARGAGKGEIVRPIPLSSDRKPVKIKKNRIYTIKFSISKNQARGYIGGITSFSHSFKSQRKNYGTTFSLFAIKGSAVFKRITIVGSIDERWLKERVQEKIEAQLNSFRNPLKKKKR